MNYSFTPDQFTDMVKSDCAGQKSRFANHFVRFINSGCNPNLFHKWFYQQLSNCFGMIAHYNKNGFYETYFTSTENLAEFLKECLQYGCYGSPEFTYCDVERELKPYMKDVLTKISK